MDFWTTFFLGICLHKCQKYYFIQYVPKYHQKLGCQANGGGARRARPPLDPPMLIFQSAFISSINLSISVIATRHWLQGLDSYTKYDTLMRLWNSRLIVESVSTEPDLLNSCSPVIQDKFPPLIAY